MSKGIIIKGTVGLVVIFMLGLFILSNLNDKETAPLAKTKVTDFASYQDIDYVSSKNGKSNFVLTIPQGDYDVDDVLYVVYNNSTSLYTKYILDSQDVDDLKTDSMELALAKSGNYSSIAASFKYVIIPSKDVEEFETLFNTDQDGKLKEIVSKPLVKEVRGTSSLIDLKVYQNEFDRNNEQIQIELMQNQLYKDSTKIQIVEINGPVIEERTLTTADIDGLRHQNLKVSIDFSDTINTLESKVGSTLYYQVKITHDEDSYVAFTFRIYIINS